VTVGRAGEGPDWRGFCAAVPLRFSASSPELAGGGWRQGVWLLYTIFIKERRRLCVSQKETANI
jgi:hypothetical protein